MNKIDKIYYINLDRRQDRNVHFLHQCKIHNLPIEKVIRYNAIDGLTNIFTKEEINMFSNVDYKGKPFERKIMGNQLSHYYILKEMVDKKYNYIIIFQDDVILKDGFVKYIDELLSNIQNDSEIINFGLHKFSNFEQFERWDLSFINDDYEQIGKTRINNNICILQDDINPCSLGYIVTLQGAKNLLEYFKNNGFHRATDWNFNDYLIKKNIFYGSCTVLCTGNTDLGTDIFY